MLSFVMLSAIYAECQIFIVLFSVIRFSVVAPKILSKKII
jgi:hypothetical protein